jgi:hypothetical protein
MKDLGYAVYRGDPFDDYGYLRSKDNIAKGIEWKGQEEYDLLAEAVMRDIQERMVNEYGLQEVGIPEDQHVAINKRDAPRSNAYMTPDFLPGFKGKPSQSALILI